MLGAVGSISGDYAPGIRRSAVWILVPLLGLATTATATAQQSGAIAFTLGGLERAAVIHLIQPDGLSRRSMGNSAGPGGAEPAWSPDGRSIAFTRASTARDGRSRGRQIYVMRADGAEAKPLTPPGSRDGDPSWSPDGSQIVFVGAHEAPSPGSPPPYSIQVINADGSNLTELIRGPETLSAPGWSPDGSRIVFSRTTRDNDLRVVDESIHLMRSDGSDQVRIGEGRQPAWSPDGSRLAFITSADRNGMTCFDECFPNGELYSMATDGTARRRLTFTKGDEANPAWSPDGSVIAFDSDRNYPDGTSGELYIATPDGRCMTWLTNGSASSTDPAWKPGTAVPPGAACVPPTRAPRFDTDVSAARPSVRYPLYWLGHLFDGLLLSGVGPAAKATNLLYWDCAHYDPRKCPDQLSLQVYSICTRHPATYGPPRLRGARQQHDLLDATLASSRFRYRGAVVAFYPSAEGFDIYVGRSTVTVFGVGPKRIRDVVRRLRPLQDRGRRRAKLPPPTFPQAFWRELDRVTTAHRRLGSVRAVQRKLRARRAWVEDRLRWASFLRRSPRPRPFRCPAGLGPPRGP